MAHTRTSIRISHDTLNQQPYVTVLYPTAGTIASIGSQKTIEWRSGGCTYVDIFYRSSGTNVSIASNYPDVGFYRWTVPNLPQAAGYTIYIDCKNSANQSLGVNSQSGAFTIAKDRHRASHAARQRTSLRRGTSGSGLEKNGGRYSS